MMKIHAFILKNIQTVCGYAYGYVYTYNIHYIHSILYVTKHIHQRRLVKHCLREVGVDLVECTEYEYTSSSLVPTVIY